MADRPPAGRGPLATVLPDLLARGSARVVDGVVVGVATGLVVWWRSADPADPPVLAFVALTHLAYLVLFEWRRGSTPGKRLAGLSVRTTDGGRPGAAAALRRNLWLLLLPFGLVGALGVPAAIAVTIARNRGRGLHDLWAGTVVVRG